MNPITQAQITQAIAKFLADGGIIIRLPDELALNRPVIGSIWGMYEGLEGITELLNSPASA